MTIIRKVIQGIGFGDMIIGNGVGELFMAYLDEC